MTMPSGWPGRSTRWRQPVRAEPADGAAMSDPYAHLVREGLEVLDRYHAPIHSRDPVKSLNEDRDELLGRMQAALEALISGGREGRRDDVVEILRKIERSRAHDGVGQ